MASNHHAVFEVQVRTREDVERLTLPALARHGVHFTGGVRGLDWNAEWGEFEPNADQELEGVENLIDALAMSISWRCACLDVRFVSWDMEFFLFSDPTREEAVGIALSFPDSLYKAFLKDQMLFAKWKSFVLDLAIGARWGAFLCGTTMLPVALGQKSLQEVLRASLSDDGRSESSIHTGALPPEALTTDLAAALAHNGFIVDALVFELRFFTSA